MASRKKTGGGTTAAGTPRKKKQDGRSRAASGRKTNNRGHDTGKASSGAIEREKQKAEALEFRLQGYSFAEVGASMEHPVSAQYAHELVTEALAELREKTTEKAAELHALENMRLDLLQTAMFNTAMQGNPEAMDRVLKIMQRRASLNGLDGPAKVSVTDPDGKPASTEDKIAAFIAIVSAAAGRAAGDAEADNSSAA